MKFEKINTSATALERATPYEGAAKARVALCLTGLVGHIGKYGRGDPLDSKISYNHFQKHLLSLNQVDVFMHSWSVQARDELVKLYTPKKHLFEPQKEFPASLTTRQQSILSRWYSTREVGRLLSSYIAETNTSYDFVLLTRFDLAMLVDFNLKNYNPLYFYTQGTDPIHGASCTKDCCNPLSGKYEINDLWFFSGPKNMATFMRAYESIDCYGTDSNHCIVARHLAATGLNTVRCSIFSQQLHRPPGTGDTPLVRWHYRKFWPKRTWRETAVTFLKDRTPYCVKQLLRAIRKRLLEATYKSK